MTTHSAISKLLGLIFLTNLHSSISAQTEKPKTFLEMNAGLMSYQSKGNPVVYRPSTGFVANAQFAEYVSAELYYSTTYIDELRTRYYSYSKTTYYEPYRALVHWGGLRMCFGKRNEKNSVYALLGVSVMGNQDFVRSGLELGVRHIYSFNENWSLNSSVILKGYSGDGYEDDGSTPNTDPMITGSIWNLQVGIGYHF